MSVSTLTFKGFRKTLSGAIQRVSNIPILVAEFEMYCLSTNSGNVYVGPNDVGSTDYIPRIANSITSFSAIDINGEPKHFNLYDLYVSGTAGDIIVVQYRVRT